MPVGYRRLRRTPKTYRTVEVAVEASVLVLLGAWSGFFLSADIASILNWPNPTAALAGSALGAALPANLCFRRHRRHPEVHQVTVGRRQLMPRRRTIKKQWCPIGWKMYLIEFGAAVGSVAFTLLVPVLDPAVANR